MTVGLISLTALALMLMLFVAWRLRKRRLPLVARERCLLQWMSLSRMADPARRVLEAEAVLEAALRAAGYTGTFGENLRHMGARFPNLDAVWAAHKLRNRIAHEPGTSVSEAEAHRAIDAFERALRSLF